MRRDLVQVAFRFPGSTEIRYLPEPPAPGDEVMSSGGRLWIVSEVRPAEFHRAYVVVCVPPDERRGLRDVASRLLERAKRSHGSEAEERGERTPTPWGRRRSP